jgi:hypothetical protein
MYEPLTGFRFGELLHSYISCHNSFCRTLSRRSSSQTLPIAISKGQNIPASSGNSVRRGLMLRTVFGRD